MRTILLFLAITIIISCEEETVDNNSTPTLSSNNFGEPKKSYTPNTCKVITSLDNPTFARKILAEEISGVRCSECIAGHEKFQTFKNFYGNRLITINYHGLSLSSPFGLSIQDFRSDQADSIYNNIGAPGFYPFAAFNRVQPSGEVIPFIGLPKWNTQILAEANKTTSDYQIDLVSTLDTCDFTLEVSTTIHANNNTTEKQLSFYIIENNIEDAQLVSIGVNSEDYIHQSVFRKAFPFALGTILPSIQKGKSTDISTKTTLDSYWETKNSQLIVVISEKNGSKEVLQVEQISIH